MPSKAKFIPHVSIFLAILIAIMQIRFVGGCSCTTSDNVYPVGSTLAASSCDTSCSTGCSLYPYANSRIYPSGLGIMLYECIQCYCSSGEVQHAKYMPGGQTWNAYSCDASCSTAGCVRMLKQTIVIDAAGSTVPIYKCKKCPANCVSCTSETSCTNCNSTSGHYKNSSGLCQTCQQLYGASCQLCNDVQCTQCYAPYGLNLTNGSQSCSPCISCQTCIDGPKCTLCAVGSFLDYSTQNQTCLACGSIVGCTSCAHGMVCLTCTGGLYLDYSTGILFVYEGNKSCEACDGNCAACVNGPRCTGCDSGFFLNFADGNKTCATCSIPSCTSCTDGPRCTGCDPGLYLDFSTSNMTCVLCSVISNCLACNDGPICTSCSNNYITNPNPLVGDCVHCPSGTYSSSNNCHPCISKCTDCYQVPSGLLCTACQAGYTPDSSLIACQSCKTVTSYCSQCSDINTCTQCQHPFKIGISGTCSDCVSGYQYLEGYCINQTGCVSQLPGSLLCIACLSKYNFVYSPGNNSCVCNEGFKFANYSNIKICVSQCGNGITSLPYEDCDDGNLRNNDGCDSMCKQENDFQCTLTSPSQCGLNYKAQLFEYNYAYKYEGQNKGRFSFSLYPRHLSFKYVQWSKYLSINVSIQYIVPNSITTSYSYETNEIFMELQFVKALQELIISAKLNFQEYQEVSIVSTISLSQQDYSLGRILVSSSKSTSDTKIYSSLGQLQVIVKLNGINSLLIPYDESIIKVYQAASSISLIITIFILIQFFIGSYYHKMIGLQTLQILQFAYFVRMATEQQNSFFVNSLNQLKYSAFGGYSNYELIYGQSVSEADSLTYMTVGKQFISSGLMKYFLMNINLSMTILIIILIFYGISLINKFRKRNQYLSTLLQSKKDEYTKLRRSSQWVYDHGVFPMVNIFNMAAFFCTFLYLQSLLSQSSTHLKESSLNTLIQTTSFSPQLILVFLTFALYCFEVFASYEELRESRMSETEKSRIPKSTIEKLEHDKNDPARPNYKPGYVLVYLVYYFVLELVIIFSILIKEITAYGIEILLILTFTYSLCISLWRPYCQVVGFHNTCLKINHFTAFLIVGVLQLFKRVKISQIFYALMIYVCLLALIIVGICGYVRIYLEYKFRKKLLDDPTLLSFDQEIIKKPSKNETESPQKQRKQALFRNNPFCFENQVEGICIKQNIRFNRLEVMNDEQISMIKNKIRRQIYGNKDYVQFLQKQQRDELDSNVQTNLIEDLVQLKRSQQWKNNNNKGKQRISQKKQGF